MDRFDLWLTRYSEAWRLGDADAVGELFAPGARYQDTPFSPPFEGREAIRAYWEQGVRHSRRDVGFAAERLAASDDALIAHWWGEFTSEPSVHRVQLDGILIAVVDADGLCTDFREWWHRLEDHG